MKTELEKMLIEKYPILYKTSTSPVTESLMCFGFECNDGWFKIIDDLSTKIEKYNESVDEDLQCVALQVKEKYGTLRFYINGGTDEVYDLIDEAEDLSEKTCEYCGAGAELRTDMSWIQTLCDEHYEFVKSKYNFQRIEDK